MLAMTLLNRFLYQLNRLRLVQYNSGDDAGDPSGESHTLLFVMEGRGDIHIDGESHPLEVGRVCCAAPGHLLQFRNVPEHSLVRAYRIEFERFGLMEHSSVHRLFRKPGFHLDSGETPTAFTRREKTTCCCEWFFCISKNDSLSNLKHCIISPCRKC